MIEKKKYRHRGGGDTNWWKWEGGNVRVQILARSVLKMSDRGMMTTTTTTSSTTMQITRHEKMRRQGEGG
jgi:uncharacterized membrane protein YdcZ (DUF606 family)